MVPDRGRAAPQRRTGATGNEEARLVADPLKPGDSAVVESVEQLAQLFFANQEERHHFHFIYGEKNWDSYPFSPAGSVKTWIVQSRRSHPDEWLHAKAVVLSYCGKGSTAHFNVVVPGDDQAYSLGIDLKNGRMKWRKLNTKTATELKEALKVAQR